MMIWEFMVDGIVIEEMIAGYRQVYRRAKEISRRRGQMVLLRGTDIAKMLDCIMTGSRSPGSGRRMRVD